MASSAQTRGGFHRLTWQDFDALARLDAGERVIRGLRRAERSRRKLLLHALLAESGKTPELYGPLPPPDAAWELLARVEARAPKALDRVLTHPYTGSWAGYTTRLLRNRTDGVGPLWTHLGHVHALAAAAAVHAGLDFEAVVPAWEGDVVLPSLGLARLPAAGSEPSSTAVVASAGGRVTVEGGDGVVVLPTPLDVDTEGWWSVRLVRTSVGSRRFSLRLDDVDPYRGLYEPVRPRRLSPAEFQAWRGLIDRACELVVTHLPEFAEVMPYGLQSLVPRPPVPFRSPSASTGEAFGSALVGRPSDGAELAATLVHEFQHIVLGSVLHLTPLYASDPRARFYVAWRDDPRPLGGALQGVYAFLGVTAFWRGLASAPVGSRRSAFEFAYWREQTWRTLSALRDDPALTEAGRRFTEGMAERLGPWRDEPIPEAVANLAAAAVLDHRAGWRVRHLRPAPTTVASLVDAWLTGRARPPATTDTTAVPPTPVADGSWSHARTDLVRLALGRPESRGPGGWLSVPGTTDGDLAYAEGRYAEAERRYRAELTADPDRPAALVGLGLALAAAGPNPGARALLHCPELVRAVHRGLRTAASPTPTPEAVASWLGQVVP
ncbi:HEXXH motif domain-containing protein [Actinophytocola xanthii]|uniref:HEXXH motif domain-containing protein n=1 Tax=Actinophytocola xanthii TaxID=1912961 RepID=A0A1Q8CGP3_9PSEU|nr:HEXXH motif domain-containing protein [Actinophytocola xanthii]OLF13526.1 HEXXH motif domain-containing protein [Actinophytocola xanthii]